ncbi:MAG: enoyl-CoA hydratase/isomerase family protein [Mycobacterium sp.]|uniref:enoyl-CoA hydratase/isomerase family protein n=1 Tax=Mycobacterium sp. TaxID=1785 RepID=UPI001EC71FB9|nr:enoyl-CoA hydratase-related protein [Mycobacterium sp.]MBV8788544.1 enoyl-CoA hydratase/isomerase family protein [Mycobacterium sp.]
MSESTRSRDVDGVRVLTFDRPERLNSFTASDYRDLHLALNACLTDDSVHAVVLTGAGRAYSAGADRSLLKLARDGQSDAGTEFNLLLEVLGGFDKPLLAAVNGVAVGIGATMLMYCDLVLVAETARLRLPFTELGIVPEAGSSALLPRRLRWPDLTWAVLSSEWIDASAAVDMGFAWRWVPDSQLLDETLSAAAKIAKFDNAAVRATKRLITAGRADIAKAAAESEAAELSRLLQGRDDS